MVNFSHQANILSALLKRLHSRWANVAAMNVDGSRFFTTAEGHIPTIVHKRSLDILHDPWFNKVWQVKPDVLLGLLAVGGLLTKEALKDSTRLDKQFFQCLILQEMEMVMLATATRIGLGTLLSGSKIVSDGMLQEAGE